MQWPVPQLQNLKVSPHEAVDTLVQKIEVVAKRDPAYYRRRLQLLAGLGYGYIVVVFVLLFGGLWCLRQLFIAMQNTQGLGNLNTFAGLIALGFGSLFFVRFEVPKGVVLTREQVPQLFSMIDELSSALKAPKLDSVILDARMNAAIAQRPKFGFIGWHTNYLMIGLPLMQALSPDQFKAVLAHELAHLCGDDGRVGAWIYRVRRTWYELAERFENTPAGGWLFRGFFSWYGPFFRAYSFVHARAQEYEADRRAADLVGAHHKAEALIWLKVNNSQLSEVFYPDFQRQAIALKSPPDDYMSTLLKALREEIDSDNIQHWLALYLAAESTNASTHPCLADRLSALGYAVPDSLLPPAQRAVTLLGDQLVPLAKQLDQLWEKEQKTSWPTLYQRSQHKLARLDRLNAKADHLLTVEEKIKRSILTWAVAEKRTVLPMFQEILKEAPNHPSVHSWLGFLLAEKQNEAGVDHLKFVIENDLALKGSACAWLYSFYLKQAQPELAEQYRQEWQAHQKLWRLALQERS